MRLSGLLSASLMTIGLKNTSARLDVIDLPLGFWPEGITNGEGWTAYVGSLDSKLPLRFRYVDAVTCTQASTASSFAGYSISLILTAMIS